MLLHCHTKTLAKITSSATRVYYEIINIVQFAESMASSDNITTTQAAAIYDVEGELMMQSSF